MSAAHSSPGPEPILNLDTLISRPRVAIDGVLFEILSAEEISVIDSHRFGVWGRRIEELTGIEGDEAEAELAALIDTVARKVLIDVPAEVFGKLSGAHRWAVVDVFTGLLLGNRLGVAGAMTRAMGPVPHELQTGASASRGSSGSMADIPPGGWKKRLQRWFGLI